jgi:hypothetical protein
MQVIEKIQQRVQELPQGFQEQVLDFVDYLSSKVERETAEQEERDWSFLSLTFAIRGMDEEDTHTYTMADLKVVFS